MISATYRNGFKQLAACLLQEVRLPMPLGVAMTLTLAASFVWAAINDPLYVLIAILVLTPVMLFGVLPAERRFREKSAAANCPVHGNGSEDTASSAYVPWSAETTGVSTTPRGTVASKTSSWKAPSWLHRLNIAQPAFIVLMTVTLWSIYALQIHLAFATLAITLFL